MLELKLQLLTSLNPEGLGWVVQSVKGGLSAASKVNQKRLVKGVERCVSQPVVSCESVKGGSLTQSRVGHLEPTAFARRETT